MNEKDKIKAAYEIGANVTLKAMFELKDLLYILYLDREAGVDEKGQTEIYLFGFGTIFSESPNTELSVKVLFADEVDALLERIKYYGGDVGAAYTAVRQLFNGDFFKRIEPLRRIAVESHLDTESRNEWWRNFEMS